MADKTPGEILQEAYQAAQAAAEVLKAMHEGFITPAQAFPVAHALNQKAKDLNKLYDQMINRPRWT